MLDRIMCGYGFTLLDDAVCFSWCVLARACWLSSFTIHFSQGSTTLVTVDCVPLTQWHDVIFNGFKQGAGYDLLVLDRCVSLVKRLLT